MKDDNQPCIVLFPPLSPPSQHTVAAATGLVTLYRIETVTIKNQRCRETYFFILFLFLTCYKFLEINLVYFVLAQFHPMKTISQPPCFDIEY